nr:IS5 family transposase [uncultured Bradyrhizobium sp.]
MAAYDRQHHRSGSFASRRRKRGTYQEAFGRSRGGFTTKIHARADGQGRPLGFLLTSGQASDYNEALALLALPVNKPKLFMGDKGYDGDSLRQDLLIHGILPVIPPKSNRKDPPSCDYDAYRDRNRIERMFNRLKQSRRIATRFDKTIISFMGFLNLAAIRIWLPNFVNRA